MASERKQREEKSGPVIQKTAFPAISKADLTSLKKHSVEVKARQPQSNFDIASFSAFLSPEQQDILQRMMNAMDNSPNVPQ